MKVFCAPLGALSREVLGTGLEGKGAGSKTEGNQAQSGLVNEGQNVIFILNIFLTSPKFWQLCSLVCFQVLTQRLHL